MAFHGRCSLFGDRQRLLFPVDMSVTSSSDRAAQQQLLASALMDGNCTGMIISELEDSEVFQDVRATVEEAGKAHSLLSQEQFVVVASTSASCAVEEIPSRVEQVLGELQRQQLDMLLLHARSLAESRDIYTRKRVVLHAWEQMLAIQQTGLVRSIGVSDLSVQDVEFLLTAYPDNPPEAWAVEVLLPGMIPPSSNANVPLEDATAFAHAHSIDLLVHFPVTKLQSLQSLEDWRLLTEQIAERHRQRPFKFLVTHEHGGVADTFHMESRVANDTTALQSPLQIIVRYLLQKGLVLIPQASDPQVDDQAHVFSELFGPLSHPFTALHPSCSPHQLYSSILTRDDLAAIDRALPLSVTFPPPTPATATGNDRFNVAQERSVYLSPTSSRPSTPE
ncbi:hypothetical protein BBJ28_00003806 [Nothophytophthora sp. Chile5]|nr:hypothetical protein BBJ28_00003806 [Nothophytophthora sp. Chile5]